MRVSYLVAAAMLGISRQDVHDLISRGKLARHPDGDIVPTSIRESASNAGRQPAMGHTQLGMTAGARSTSGMCGCCGGAIMTRCSPSLMTTAATSTGWWPIQTCSS